MTIVSKKKIVVDSLMNRKAQAGLEYLVTYGWALVLVAAVVGVLTFVAIAPAEGVAFNSSDPTKLMVKGGVVENGQARIKLQNVTGGEIKNIQVSGKGNYTACGIVPQNTGAGGEIEIICDVIGDPMGSVDVTFDDYAGLEQKVEVSGGSPITPMSPGGETICADGLDNDFDGYIDCLDSDCAGKPECEPQAEDCAVQGDEDLDGTADCADEDCDGMAGPQGQTCEFNEEETCSDILDNDGDADIDCSDDDCSGRYCNSGQTKVCINSQCVQGNSITGCTTIGQSGTYALGQDIYTTDNRFDPCINITTSNVVLDCQGKQLIATPPGEPAPGFIVVYPMVPVPAIQVEGWIGSTNDNIEIKNCAIKGFTGGIMLISSDHAKITNNNLFNNGEGISLSGQGGALDVEITGNTLINNGLYGISLWDNYSNVSINNNTVCSITGFPYDDPINCGYGTSQVTGTGNTAGEGGTFCGIVQATACDPQENCTDEEDNDSDGKIDCADEECDAASGAQGQLCQPFGETRCEDTEDNDGDGLADCSDPDCDPDPWCEPRALGELCLNNTECSSNFCIEGICCDGVCSGTCQLCNLTSSVGTCTIGTDIGGGQCLGPELVANGDFSQGTANWNFGDLWTDGWSLVDGHAQFGPNGILLDEWSWLAQESLQPLENRTFVISLDVLQATGEFEAEVGIGRNYLPINLGQSNPHIFEINSGSSSGSELAPFYVYAYTTDAGQVIFSIDNISVKEKFID